MADSLPLQPQGPESPSAPEPSLGSAPTVVGSERDGDASTMSAPNSTTSGDNIRGLKEALQRRKEALVERKRQLDSGPLRVSRSDESTDDPHKLHNKLSQLRERLEILDPIVAQLDADYTVTADIISRGKTTASKTELKLMSDISDMRRTIKAQETSKGSLEHQIEQLGQGADTDPLRTQLVHLLCDLEINKLEACSKMHEAAALISRAQRHGEATEAAPGYISDQGTSSGYASEAASARLASRPGGGVRTPFSCDSHQRIESCTGGETDTSDLGDDYGLSASAAAADSPSNHDVILPWNMRPAANYYFVPPDATCSTSVTPGSEGGGVTYSTATSSDGGSRYIPPPDAADYDGPQPHSVRTMQRIFDEGTPHTLGVEDWTSLSELQQTGTAAVGTGATGSRSDTDMMYATNLAWHGSGPDNWNAGQRTPPTPADQSPQRGSRCQSAKSKNGQRAARDTNDEAMRPYHQESGSQAAGMPGLMYMTGLSYPAQHSAASQGTSGGGSPASAASVAPHTPATTATRDQQAYTAGLVLDDRVNWPPSPATPSRTPETLGPRALSSEERVRDVAQHLMSRLPSVSTGSPGGYIRGPVSWPPSPPTPCGHDNVIVDADRQTVVVRHGGAGGQYAAGLWAGPVDWPGPPSVATPASRGSPGLVHVHPRSGSSGATQNEHSSSETLVRDDGSPRAASVLPWNIRPASNYSEPADLCVSTPTPVTDRYVEPPDAAGYDGPQPHTVATLQRVFDEGTPHEVPSVYYTPPEKCGSSEMFYTPAQSENEMMGNMGRTEQEMRERVVCEQQMHVPDSTSPESLAPYSRTPSGQDIDSDQSVHYVEREVFASRAERLMSRYEGLQPCLPPEALQQANDGSEPWSSPRSIAEHDLRVYEPAQGEYGYQRYPQGYEPPQLWYGHERASLPSDAGSEVAPATNTTSDGYAPSQGESDYPPSLDDTSVDADSMQTAAYGESGQTTETPALSPSQDNDYDGPSPDTARSLARIFEEGIPHGGGGPPGGGGGGPPGGRVVSSGSGSGMPPSDGYEPAQGEYGYQRYPQGYEPPQMWYGHDRASLAKQRAADEPASSLPPLPAAGFNEGEDFESISPDTTRSLARIFQDGTPYRVEGNEAGAGSPVGGPPGIGSTEEDYQPAQGEYGYQRYPQGYEPPQMWYGHDRASLESQSTAGTMPSQAPAKSPTSLPDSDRSAFEDAEDLDFLEPDTTRTLARILEGETPSALRRQAAGGSQSSGQVPREGYEPAQGEYGYQRYPQGYEPAQMWYGHDRASLPKQEASEASETSAFEVAEDFDFLEPDTTRTLARILEGETPSALRRQTAGGSQSSGQVPREGYEPAQGEYGYQRYPQGYEPAQMWYGHDRASLPKQGAGETGETSAFEVAEDHDFLEPDTTRTLARILEGETPSALRRQTAGGSQSSGQVPREGYEPAQGEYGYQRYPQGYEPAQMWYGHDRASLPKQGAGETGETSAFEVAENHDFLEPDTTRTLARILEGETPSALRRQTAGGSQLSGQVPREGYEPAQGEYGYQRYPQGYEPAQMWYGHDRASLPKQGAGETPAPSLQSPAPTGLQEGHPYPFTATMEDNLAVTCQDYTPSQTSLASVETPPASRSLEYVPATGMYGFQPVFGPPSRGSVEHLPASDTYTQGLCASDSQQHWPPTPPTPSSLEDMSASWEDTPDHSKKAIATAMDQYTSGLRWDAPKEWAPTPGTPSSAENLTTPTTAVGQMGQFTSGLRWDAPKEWPPTPSTPASVEDLPAQATTTTTGQYSSGIRWDAPKDWPSTPKTPASIENLSERARARECDHDPPASSQHPSGLREDATNGWPPTPPTPSSQEHLAHEAADTVPALPAGLGDRYEPAQGEYGYQRYPQGYEPAQMWYGHDRASLSPRSSQDLGSMTMSSADPSPRADVAPHESYEPAQGIYGFQRLLSPAPALGATDRTPAVAVGSDDNLAAGPGSDASRSLERIFEAGDPHPVVGSQRTTTPSPNLPAFLEKLTSSSESEDSASRNRQRRPTDSPPAVRVPRNRFYSMEEMCTTAPSQPNLALSSSRLHLRSGDQQCYLPWTCRAATPFRNPSMDQCVNYQEPPLVNMDDRSSVPTPSSQISRRTDSDNAPSQSAGYLSHSGGSGADTPPTRYQPPADAASYDQKLETLAGESKSVEDAHNDIEDMLQRLRSLESRLHSVEGESQSKDRQIQDLVSRLENLVTAGNTDSDLNHRLQAASDTVVSLKQTESKLRKELEDAKKEIDNYLAQLASFQGRSEEIEQRLSESQRLQAAGDQQLQDLAQQCGQLAAERDQLGRQLEQSAANVADKESRITQLMAQLQEYRSRVEQLETEAAGDGARTDSGAPAVTPQMAAENSFLRGRVEELEQESRNGQLLKEQVQEADERARAMEKAFNQLISDKRTEEERRREVETQLVQMVRKTSMARATISDGIDTSPPEESSADELLDPQLCRRLQQLLDKLHTKGLQELNLTELRFVKSHASSSQLTPRSQAAESVVNVSDVDAAALRRAMARLAAKLAPNEQQMNTHVTELAAGLKRELDLVQELQRDLAAEHDTKLALTDTLGRERSAGDELETNLAQMRTSLANLRGADDRPDKTRSNQDSQLQQFAAAKTAVQQLVDREQKIMQELSRTTDAGCRDLERVKTCLAKLDGAGDNMSRLLSKSTSESTVKRLAEEVLAEQQRCRDMLVCLECERGRAAQLTLELDQGRGQAQADGCTSDKLEKHVADLQMRRQALGDQVSVIGEEVMKADQAAPDVQMKLDVRVKHLLQDVRQVQGSNAKAVEEVQRPAADQSQKAARLQRSATDALSTVTTVVDTNVEAERIRTHIIQLACELAERDEEPPEPAPAPAEIPAPAAAAPSRSPAADQPQDDEHGARWQQQLESERTKWRQERALLRTHIEQLDAELERLRVSGAQRQPEPLVSQGEGDDGRVQEATSRYLRAESYRRALCWQKRYLMILLGGYQDTETMTLDKMVRLTGGCFMPDCRRLLEPVRKFRAVAWTVIAMLRMQYMVNRWRSGSRVAAGGRRREAPSFASRQPGRTAPASHAQRRSSSRSQPPPPPLAKRKPATRGQSPPKKTSKPPTMVSPQPKKPPSRKNSPLSKSSPSPARAASPPPPSEDAAVEPDDTELDLDDEVTPRGESSADVDYLIDDEGIDGTDATARSVSRASTMVFEDLGYEPPLTPPQLLSDISLTSGESECVKFISDYAHQLAHYSDAPNMEMECGTTGSMPNLMGCDDVRSVMTVSDVESDELELYLSRFDSLLVNQNYSSSRRGSSTSSHSSMIGR